jgi:hypothetical protein
VHPGGHEAFNQLITWAAGTHLFSEIYTAASERFHIRKFNPFRLPKLVRIVSVHMRDHRPRPLAPANPLHAANSRAWDLPPFRSLPREHGGDYRVPKWRIPRIVLIRRTAILQLRERAASVHWAPTSFTPRTLLGRGGGPTLDLNLLGNSWRTPHSGDGTPEVEKYARRPRRWGNGHDRLE